MKTLYQSIFMKTKQNYFSDNKIYLIALSTPETQKLLGCIESKIIKDKIEKNASKLEVAYPL